ncbi:MAG: peptidase U35 phage prohead HK97 [Rhodospirillaceae bacterium]|nr:MAG: peptidase U35 phage prohead HK97 [Rhodospirillaceae bacterium]
MDSGRLTLIIEPRLSSTTRWYIVADPVEMDGLEYAYLSGAEGAMVESQPSRDIDGVDVTVKMDFGCGFVDHRGWYANAGA